MQKPYKSQYDELSKCFQIPQLINFVDDQLKSLRFRCHSLRCSSRFAVLKFRTPNSTAQYKFTTDNDSIQFILVLGKSYPIAPPRLHVVDNLLRPGINDCRDLLPAVLNFETQPWSHKITLQDIQQKLVEFLAKLDKDKDIFYIARIGQFQLNSVYPMQVLQDLRGENLFFAFEIFNISEGQFKMVIIDVSTTHMAIFVTKQQPFYNGDKYEIPDQKSITNCMLIFYAQIGCLSQMLVNRTNFSDMQLSFTSRKPHNLALQTCTKTKRFKVKKGIVFIRKLIKNRKYYELSQIKLQLCPQSIKGEQQKELLQKISKAQQAIQHHLNIETIKSLADAYQTAVEYYSIQSVPYYEIYLQYITRLYQRQDVKTIMGTSLPAMVKRASSN